MLLALATCIGIAGITYVVFAMWPRWPGVPAMAAHAPALPITVGGINFNIPPDSIRVSMQRRPGAQSRLDLAFPWPELTARPATAKTIDLESLRAFDQIFVTIVDAGGTMALTERLKVVYSRYVASEARPGPEGLLIVSFRDGTPYQGEDLFFQESQPEAFIARCTRAVGAAPGTCLYEQRIGGTNITVRFPREWLKEWVPLSQGFQRLLTMLHPATS